MINIFISNTSEMAGAVTEIASPATGAAQQNYPQALQFTERHIKVNVGLGFELCSSRSASPAFWQDADHQEKNGEDS